MILYVSEYYLTFLRVFVLWFLAVLMIIFFGVIYSIYRRISGFSDISQRWFQSATFCFLSADRMRLSRSIISGTPVKLLSLMSIISCIYPGDTVPVLAEIDKDEIRDTAVLDSLDDYFRSIAAQEQQMS